VRLSKTPAEAKVFAHGRKHLWRPDWEQVKCEVMRKALMAKFTCSAFLREELIKTNNAVLIENSKKDFFWGIGSDNSGKNMLGLILMEIRKLLNAEYSANKILDISLIRKGDAVVKNKIKECEGLKAIYPFERDWNKYRQGYINGVYPSESIEIFIATLRAMDCKALVEAHEANVPDDD
jgi:hypothetical protein